MKVYIFYYPLSELSELTQIFATTLGIYSACIMCICKYFQKYLLPEYYMELSAKLLLTRYSLLSTLV